MIKYLGSKRRLVPVLSEICRAAGASTALDLFTGTTRVAQAFKAQGVHVTAVDSARYAHVFARTYVEADAASTDVDALGAAVARLDALPGVDGYVTETFSRQSRFFQPHNAARIDAVREAIETEFAGSALYPLLLTSLIEAADRVDSTTGLQMAYVKQWAPRSFNPLELRVPQLLDGPGRAVKGDAVELAPALGHFDLAYLDPPYNQHRYFTNYHVWETLVAWDAPEAYGVARKRIDARDPSTRSVFNSKRTMPGALASVVASVDCDLLVLSYNDEAWLALDELEAMCAQPGLRGQGPRAVATLAFDSARYVGARIGIFDPSGRKVGRVGHLSNRELLVIAGEADLVRHVVDATRSGESVPDEGPVRGPGRGRPRAHGESTTTVKVSKHDHGGHGKSHHDAGFPRLEDCDLSLRLSKDEEAKRLGQAQRRLLHLRLINGGQLNEGTLGPPVCIVFEGWDAAGKGGAIKRLVEPLDPRHVHVAPFAAPTYDELRHHFLWRFWPPLPGWGGMTIFDRSWYGRVLVERVENLATEVQWRRAYQEINDFEHTLAEEGMIVIKLWMHLSHEEQLRRFIRRRDDPLKSWKLTDEDWRNREKRGEYDAAVSDMLRLTHGPLAPWDVISSENKRYGRVEVIETVIRRMEAGMERWGVPVPSYGEAEEKTELALMFDDPEFQHGPEGPPNGSADAEERVEA